MGHHPSKSQPVSSLLLPHTYLQRQLISGGASGIGRSVAHVFMDDGAKVAILDIGEDRVKKAVDEIIAAGHTADDVVGIVCDVTNNDRVKEAVAEVVAKFKKIDCVVCCAGIGAVNAGCVILNLNGLFKWSKLLTFFATATPLKLPKNNSGKTWTPSSTSAKPVCGEWSRLACLT